MTSIQYQSPAGISCHFLARSHPIAVHGRDKGTAANSNRGPSSQAAYAGEVFPPPFASPATQFYSPWKTYREGFWLW